MTETKQTNIEDSKLVEYLYDGTDGLLDFSEDKLQGIIFDFTNHLFKFIKRNQLINIYLNLKNGG